MAFSQSDLDNLDKAIASDTAELQFQQRRKKMRTMAELIEARALIEGQVNSDSSATPIIRQQRVVTAKGW